MHEDTARLVHPVLTYGLELKARLERGESVILATEQAALESRLTIAFAPSEETPDLGDSPSQKVGKRLRTIQYALVCWLDETFILDSPWETTWNERKLEVSLYGTNDRAWKFWELARRPETRADGDILEVFFLCVLLGFRGELRGEPARLREWVDATRTQLAGRSGLEWSYPPHLDPTTHVPALRGHEQLQRVVFAGYVTLLASIPFVTFFLIYRLGH